MEDLQQAYAAYQAALVNLPNPKVRSFVPPGVPLFRVWLTVC